MGVENGRLAVARIFELVDSAGHEVNHQADVGVDFFTDADSQALQKLSSEAMSVALGTSGQIALYNSYGYEYSIGNEFP